MENLGNIEDHLNLIEETHSNMFGFRSLRSHLYSAFQCWHFICAGGVADEILDVCGNIATTNSGRVSGCYTIADLHNFSLA